MTEKKQQEPPVEGAVGASVEGAGAGEGAEGAEVVDLLEKRIEMMQGWARFYVSRLGWTVSPCWLPEDRGEQACMCPEGPACPFPGKHLVDARRMVRASQGQDAEVAAAEDRAAVERIWDRDHPDVRRGAWGIAVLAGSESQLLCWDVPPGVDVPPDWLDGRGSLVARSPSGGRHWFFALDPGEATRSPRIGDVLPVGGDVLVDGAYVAVHPRRGYSWVTGMDELRSGSAALAPVPVGLRTVLEQMDVLVEGVADIHEDSPWRCLPGAGLAGTVPRTYTRIGDVRRFVDHWGHRVRWTPGRGWALWTSSEGWTFGEGAEAGIAAIIADGLPGSVRDEASTARAAGLDDQARKALRWADGMAKRSTRYVSGELDADPRIALPGTGAWDRDKDIVGLPMSDGVGRVVDLATGRVAAGQRERLVSKVLGAGTGGGGGAVGGGRGGRAVRRYLDDLERVHGPDFVRLLQRAAGASMFGAGGIEAAAERTGGVGAGSDSVFVLMGPPRSGKSTFVETLAAVMGQYARPMNADLLFGRGGSQGFTVSAIEGLRMIHLSEPPVGADLNVPLLKSLSGGDSLTGRGVHQRQERSFTPDASVWLVLNHQLTHSDEALWQRMKLFHFQSDFSGKAGESWIREEMRGREVERESFLQWVLEGAAAVVQEGWGDVSLWESEVEEQRLALDPVERFIAEMLVVGTGAAGSEVTESQLRLLWKEWLAVGDSDGAGGLTGNHVLQELRYRLVRAGAVWTRGPHRFQNVAMK